MLMPDPVPPPVLNRKNVSRVWFSFAPAESTKNERVVFHDVNGCESMSCKDS